MITKGIIVKVVDKYRVQVRIPVLDKIATAPLATPDSELSTAIICTLPNCIVNPHVQDIVIVGFEDNNLSKPIILGYLFSEYANATLPSLNLSCIDVKSTARLSEHTTIGNVTAQEISALTGIEGNIQKQFEQVWERIRNIESKQGE